MIKTAKPYFYRFMLAIGSILTTLLMLEILVRLLMPQQLIDLRPDVYVSLEGVGHRFRPSLNTIVNPGEGDSVLLTDSKGYRIGRQMDENAASKILAIGDSYLAAIEVDYEKSFCGILEANLSEQQSTRLVNTGVPGYNPNHYLIVAKNELGQDDYDMVIVFVFLGNDIEEEKIDSFPPRQGITRFRLRIPQNLTKSEIVDSLFRPINDTFESHSHLFVLFKKSTRVLLARLGLTGYEMPTTIQTSMAQSPAWEVTADIFEDIEQEAAKYDIPTLFVLLPASYQVDDHDREWYLEAFNLDPNSLDIDQPSQLLGAAMEAKGLTFIDVTEVMRKQNRSLFGEVYNHFSPDGHQVVADFVLPYLQLENNKTHLN